MAPLGATGMPGNLAPHVVLKDEAFASTTLTAGGTVTADLLILDQSSGFVKPRPYGGLLGLRVNPTIAGSETATLKADITHDDDAIDANSPVLVEGSTINMDDSTAEFLKNIGFDLSAAKVKVGVRLTATFSAANTDNLVIDGSLALGGFDGEFDSDAVLAQMT